MIVTHTQNVDGHRRVYLGSASSISCWIEPADDGTAWSIHTKTDRASHSLSDEAQRDWVRKILLNLAEMLHLTPHDLKTVPFETIAALHTNALDESERRATPYHQRYANAFVTTPPDIKRSRSDFTKSDFTRHKQRH